MTARLILSNVFIRFALRRRVVRPSLLVVVGVFLAGVVGACSGTGPAETESVAATVVDSEVGIATAGATTEAVPTAPGYRQYEAGKTVVATVLAAVAEIRVYDSPTATTPKTTLANPVRKGTPRLFVAEGEEAGRLLVQLPIRPNGSKGWINASDATLASHEYSVTVALSAFRITVRNGTTVVLEAPVGVGRENVPSPSGTYYITELLKPPTADSVYGSYAYGLSGFSEVLQQFRGGPGQVGIHGTNDPSSVGRQASNGCIRLRNDDIERLVPLLPLGTPVRITA